MPNPVVHWEIMGADAKQLQDFYASVFDWKVDVNNQWNYGMVQKQDDNGIGGGIGATPDSTNRVTVYVQVDDLDAYLKKAESLGGKTLMPPTNVDNMVTLALFADPAGNVTGLVKG